MLRAMAFATRTEKCRSFPYKRQSWEMEGLFVCVNNVNLQQANRTESFRSSFTTYLFKKQTKGLQRAKKRISRALSGILIRTMSMAHPRKAVRDLEALALLFSHIHYGLQQLAALKYSMKLNQLISAAATHLCLGPPEGALKSQQGKQWLKRHGANIHT